MRSSFLPLSVSACRHRCNHAGSECILIGHMIYLIVRRSGPHLAAYQRGAAAKGDAEGALLPPGRVPRSEFTSNKLAPKLAQQLKVGTLPSNCPGHCIGECNLNVVCWMFVCSQFWQRA